MKKAVVSIALVAAMLSIGIKSILFAKAIMNNTKLEITSSAFKNNRTIDTNYLHTNCGGKNMIPPLTWSKVPANTKTIAIICDDPDAPHGTWDHWIIINIPAQFTHIDENNLQEILQAGALQLTNSWNETNYGGPCPPKGHGNHHYHFKIFALDTDLKLKASSMKKNVEHAMSGHILAQGEIVGLFGR